MSNYFFILFLFFSAIGYAQTSSESSREDLQAKGKALLDRQVTYANTQPLLSQALKALRAQGINVVYSSSALGAAIAPKIPASRQRVGTLLEQLLSQSAYDYVAIGNTVAIVSGKVSVDTAAAPSPQKTPGLPHVLSGQELNFNHIPAKERRKVKALLQQELRAYGLEIVPDKDSLVVGPMPSYPAVSLYAQIGLAAYALQERGSSTYDWRGELQYVARTRATGRFEWGLSYEQRSYFLSLGMAFQQLSAVYNWVEMKKNGNLIDLPDKSNAGKVKYLSDVDRWFLFSLPLNVGYVFRYHKHSLSPALSLAHTRFWRLETSADDKYADYYKIRSPKSKYAESSSKGSTSLGLTAKYTYRMLPRVSLHGVVSYAFFLTPLTRNPLFRTYPDHFSVSVGASYRLDN